MEEGPRPKIPSPSGCGKLYGHARRQWSATNGTHKNIRRMLKRKFSKAQRARGEAYAWYVEPLKRCETMWRTFSILLGPATCVFRK